MSRRFPWYLGLPFAMGCAAGGLMVLNVIRLMAHGNPLFDAWNAPTRFAVLPLIIVSLLWLAWVFPVLAARDPLLRFGMLPRQRLFIMHVMIWTSALGMLIIAVFCLVVLPIATSLGGVRGWVWDFEQRVGLWMLAMLLPVAWWNHRLSKQVTRWFHQTVRELKLCFNCKYDLRVSPDKACPECGWGGDGGGKP